MKNSITSLFAAAACALGTVNPGLAAEYEWLLDPVPFEHRPTRLPEISVHRYVVSAGTGRVLERRYLLTAGGLLARSGDYEVPVAVTIPSVAFDKLLVSASAWLAYGQLGPQALANFRLVNDLESIDIAGRWHFEVELSPEANGNVGLVPNLSSRGEVTPTVPLVGGFVVEGRPRTVLIRAVGPGLRPFGVTNAISSARLQLYLGGLLMVTNEDWSANPAQRVRVEAATARTGAFPLAVGSRDAATVITLSPGAYTAHAGGAATGAVLLEVYLLQ